MNEWIDAETHVERAHEAYEDGRWDDAESELRRALAINPHKPEWHFNLGLTLEAAGRYDDAIKAFTDGHHLDATDAQTMMLLGVNFLRSGKPREAIEWLARASAADPSDVNPLVHAIEAHARNNDHDQAEVMFYLAQQINPKHAGSYANLAESLLSRGMHEKAVWCLRQAAHIDPKMPLIHARLAQAYARSGRLERARQLYLRELREDPGDIDTLLDLGCLLVDMNRFADAGEKFRRTLELESDNAHARFYLADLAERQGQTDSAMEQFQTVLRLDAEFPGVRRRLAALLLHRGRPGDHGSAKELLTDELSDTRLRPENFVADDLEELGRVMLDAGLWEHALAVLQSPASIESPTPEALHLLGVSLFQTGRTVEGIRVSRRAVRLQPGLASALHNLALAHVALKRWNRARCYVRKLLRLNPDDSAMRRLRLKLLVLPTLTALSRVFSKKT